MLYVQLERATALSPWEDSLNRGWFECRKKLRLLPMIAPPELGKTFLRPETAISRAVLGAGYIFAWGGGGNGCLGLGEKDTVLLPKTVDSLRGKHVRVFPLRPAVSR
jgi:hypothetical protein